MRSVGKSCPKDVSSDMIFKIKLPSNRVFALIAVPWAPEPTRSTFITSTAFPRAVLQTLAAKSAETSSPLMRMATGVALGGTGWSGTDEDVGNVGGAKMRGERGCL